MLRKHIENDKWKYKKISDYIVKSYIIFFSYFWKYKFFLYFLTPILFLVWIFCQIWVILVDFGHFFRNVPIA